MNYYTMIYQQACKKSQQSTLAEDFARTIEADEGRMCLKVKFSIDPFKDKGKAECDPYKGSKRVVEEEEEEGKQ